MSADDDALAVLSQVIDLGGEGPTPQELALGDSVREHVAERPDRVLVNPDPETLSAFRLAQAIAQALDELGVPTDDYPAPVANAVRILTEALHGGEP